MSNSYLQLTFEITFIFMINTFAITTKDFFFNIIYLIPIYEALQVITVPSTISITSAYPACLIQRFIPSSTSSFEKSYSIRNSSPFSDKY